MAMIDAHGYLYVAVGVFDQAGLDRNTQEQMASGATVAPIGMETVGITVARFQRVVAELDVRTIGSPTGSASPVLFKIEKFNLDWPGDGTDVAQAFSDWLAGEGKAKFAHALAVQLMLVDLALP